MKKFALMLLVLLLGSLSLRAEDSYNFPVIGDFHYDKWELHDIEYVHNNFSSVMYEIVRYSKSTEKFSPILLETVAKKIDKETPFVIQLGDFTEGMCGSEKLQDKMFQDGFKMVKNAFPTTPFLMTKGNHDIRGIGAEKSYKRIVLPFLSEEIGKKIDSANYFIRQNRDLFVFFDAINPDLDWLESCLKENSNSRYIFIFSHYPIVPFEFRADWLVLGNKKFKSNRERMINMLAKANAIVFCAHMHRAAYLKYENEFGSFTQVAHNSVWLSKNPKVLNLVDGTNFYSEKMVEGKTHKSATQKAYRKLLINQTKPYIKDYFYADSQGYMVVTVDNKDVRVDFFNGIDATPFKSIWHKK